MARREVADTRSVMVADEARNAAVVRIETMESEVVVESEVAERKVESAFSWADLPPDVVIDIAGRLWGLDFCAMREVCTSWCRPVTFRPRPILSRFLPLAIPYDRAQFSQSFQKITASARCFLSTGSVYILRAPCMLSSSSQSAGFFLLFAEEFYEGRLCLRNLLSRVLVRELPYQMNNMLNLLDCNAKEVAKFYSISLVSSETVFGKFKKIIKVAVLPNGCSAVLLSDAGVLLVLNLVDREWGVLHDAQGYKLDDIVELNGKVLGVDRRGTVYSLEYNGQVWKMSVVETQISGGGSGVGAQISAVGPSGGRRKRLVVSSGDLYLLSRCFGPNVSQGTGLKVFKLKVGDQRWVHKTHLCDQIFIVGEDLSFSLSTEGLGGDYIKNYVLFTEDSFPCYHSMGKSYQGKDELSLGVFSLDEGGSADQIASPMHTNIFWPPPVWLYPRVKPIDMLRIGTRRLNSRIQEAIGDPYSIDYFKQQFLDYVQFYGAIKEFIVQEIDAMKQSLLECSSHLQDPDEMGSSCGVEGGDVRKLSMLAWDRAEALKEIHGLIDHALNQFGKGDPGSCASTLGSAT